MFVSIHGAILLLAGLVALAGGLWAQAPEGEEPPVAAADLQQGRKTVEDDELLAEDRRQQILKLYDEALQFIADEGRLRAQARRFARDRTNVGRETISLQAELDRPTPAPTINLPENASAVRIETTLTQERAELEARRQALSDLDKLSESRTGRRMETANRIGVLNQRSETLDDDMRSLAQLEMGELNRAATRSNIRAEAQRVRQEIATLRAEQVLLDSQAELIPLRKDRAQRRAAESRRLVALLEERMLDSRRSEAEASLVEIRELCRTARESNEVLLELANETEEFADTLWGESAVVVAVEDSAQSLTVLQRYIGEIQQISSLTRRKFEAVRLVGIAAQWWPTKPDDLPQPAELRQALRRREAMLPNVQHRLIEIEERRVEVGNIEQQVGRWMGRIRQIDDTSATADLEQTVRSLVSERRGLLDELTKHHTRYADQLFEASAATRELLTAIRALDEYTMERVFWVRSVPGPKIPPLIDVTSGARWFFSPSGWAKILGEGLSRVHRDFWLVFGVIGIGLLLFFRRRLKEELARLAVKIPSPDAGSYLDTVLTLGLTLGLAAPLPAICWWLSRLFSGQDSSGLARAASNGFLYVATLATAVEILIQIMRADGLGERHFGWWQATTRQVQASLRGFLVLAMPVGFVVAALAEVGLRFHSIPTLRAYSNGLGRLFFVIFVLILLVTVWRIFRPAGSVMKTIAFRYPDSWALRLRHIWYVVLIFIVATPAVLTANGYFVTGFMLVTQAMGTLFLIVGLIVVRELLVRAEFLRAKSLLRKVGGTELTEAELEDRARTASARAQVRQLVSFVIGVLTVAVTIFIWSGLLPSLQVFNRVEIWPTLQVHRDLGVGGPLLSEPDSLAAKPADVQDATPAVPGASIGGAGIATSARGAEAGPQSRLLLSGLLMALLALIVTVVIAKNVPGLLEFVILRQMPLEPGVRTAATTLLRYVLSMIGISITASIIGLSWQKIQWLAAALTFGIGFGLQEIFANFASGLILLIDRPIRVGDVVTVGDVGGWVTKISIRATTITKWDRSELIVPNKDFITNQLTNWTLSNPLTRVELKVGVAYESDVEQVRQVLLDVAHAHPAVLDDPAPYAVLMEFGNSSINFELRVYINFAYGRLTLRDEIQRGIVQAFRENEIAIAFPQLDLHVDPAPPEAAPPVRETPPVAVKPPSEADRTDEDEEITPKGLQEDADD